MRASGGERMAAVSEASAIATESEPRPSAAARARSVPTLIACLAGAALLTVSEPAGAVFVLLALTLAVLLLIWGWPILTDSPEPTGTRLSLAVTAAAIVLAGYQAPYGIALRHLPVAIAVGLIAAFLMQLVRGDIKAGVVTALTSAAGGLTLVASVMAMAVLPDLRGADRPLALAAAGIAAGLFAELLPARMRGLTLLAGTALGACGGLIGALLVPTSATTAAAAVLGACASVVALATRVALGELPGSRYAVAPAVIAAASLAAPGFVIVTIAKLLLG